MHFLNEFSQVLQSSAAVKRQLYLTDYLLNIYRGKINFGNFSDLTNDTKQKLSTLKVFSNISKNSYSL